MNNKIKKYFLKDKELSSLNEDKLNQKDVVNNLSLIIENTDSPYNIALIGKCGIGKTSIINELLKKYKKDTQNYIVQEINAWKCENEDLNVVLAEELCKNSNLNNINKYKNVAKIKSQYLKQENSEEINEDEKTKKIKENQKSSFFNILLELLGAFILTLLVTIPVFAVGKFLGDVILEKFYFSNFLNDVFRSYINNIKYILIFPTIVSIAWSIIRNTSDKCNKSKYNTVETNCNSSKNELLPNTYKLAITEMCEINGFKKIITVIDDLDKLSSKNILKLLNELKSFENLNNCIFIVPFDENIILEVLRSNFDNNVTINNFKSANSVNVLEKIFQYKVQVPAILHTNIKEYAVELAKNECSDFIAQYCNIDTFEQVIKKVLIHKGVSTPRQAKKIINNFINNKIIISNRNENGKIEKEIFEDAEFDFKLAKISVLQVEFPEFYNVLLTNYNYIHKFMELYNKGAETKLEYKPLINFLKQTEKYEISDPVPFIYLIQDDASVKYGNNSCKNLFSAMVNKNTKIVRNIIEENNNIIDSVLYKLETIEEDVELVNSIETIINSFDVIYDENASKSVAILVCEKMHSLGVFKEEYHIPNSLNIYNLLDILLLADSKENICNILSNNVERIIYEVFENNCNIDFLKQCIKYINSNAIKAIFNKLLECSKYTKIKINENYVSELYKENENNTEKTNRLNYENINELNDEISLETYTKFIYKRYEQIFKILCVEQYQEYVVEFIKSIIENYNMNPSNRLFFLLVYKYVHFSRKFIKAKLYARFIKMVTLNYNYYSEDVIHILKNVKGNIPEDIIIIFLDKVSNNVPEGFSNIVFSILRKNSDCFYDNAETIAKYVSFLIGIIKTIDNPNEIIEELDENFTRISKVYELTKNVQNLDGLDYENTYKFISKCIDNGSFERLIADFNSILSNENTIDICLNIEKNLTNYSLNNVIEYDIDCLQYLYNYENNNTDDNESEDEEYLNYARTIKKITLLKNILGICIVKQKEISSSKTIFVISSILELIQNKDSIINTFELISEFEKDYFYSNRKDFIDVLYNCFHLTEDENIKKKALDCARSFRFTQLFRNKLNTKELDFYNKNM